MAKKSISFFSFSICGFYVFLYLAKNVHASQNVWVIFSFFRGGMGLDGGRGRAAMVKFSVKRQKIILHISNFTIFFSLHDFEAAFPWQTRLEDSSVSK